MDCLFIAVFDSLGQILLFTVLRSLMLYPDVTTMLNVLLASKNPIKSVKKKKQCSKYCPDFTLHQSWC